MSSNENIFDIFLSYNWDSKDVVKKLYKKFVHEHEFKVWIDDSELHNEMLYSQIAEGIRHAKCFVCCITKKYTESLDCQRELNYASDLKKPIIVLMFENLKIDTINGSVGFIISPLLRCNLYNEMDRIKQGNWKNPNMDSVIKTIESKIDNSTSQEFNQDKPYFYTKESNRSDSSEDSAINSHKFESTRIDFLDGVYEGQVKYGNRHGRGIFRYHNGMIHDGNWFNGLQHGSGEEIFPSNDRFKGRCL